MGKPIFDRRGFQTLIYAVLAMIPISLCAVPLLNDWRIGLVMFLLFCISFITLEAVTARPDNNPSSFIRWKRTQDRVRPVLLCLGDSLMHGNGSASITPEIPLKLTNRIGLEPATYGKTFADPLWVVNAGQNHLTSHAVLTERLSHSISSVQPDYICIMVGSNDVRAMYNGSWSSRIVNMNQLPHKPSMQVLETNMTKMLEFIQEASPMAQVGVCTLPPMGEDLKSRSNALVKEANAVIERVVSASTSDRVAVIPVFDPLESILEKEKRGWTPPVDMFMPIAMLQNVVFHLTPLKSWNTLSKPFGFHVLSDALHLNERGRDVVVDSIVEWLVEKNITKTIAVKR